MDSTILSPQLSLQILLTIFIWTIPWKAVALWKAAKNGHKIWFICLLVLNTLALLEIVYIFFFAKKKEVQPPINQ